VRNLLLAITLLCAAPAAAQIAPPVVTPPPAAPAITLELPEQALARDAGEYARDYGVPLDEARRRLAAQEDSVAATDALAAEFAGRLTGIVVEHRPAWRIVVVLARSDPVPERRILASGLTVPVVFRTGAGSGLPNSFIL